jgi:hypothetical protein
MKEKLPQRDSELMRLESILRSFDELEHKLNRVHFDLGQGAYRRMIRYIGDRKSWLIQEFKDKMTP